MSTYKPSTSGWVIGAERHARVRLFCFPYAGGGASVFRHWNDALPPEVDVCAIQLPGREARVWEPPIVEWPTLIGRLEEAIVPWMDCPFAFFGHSLGAVVAYELTRALRRNGRAEPRHLFVSARGAPHLPLIPEPIHALGDAEFITELRRLNGTPDEVLGNEDLMSFLLPVLRADFRLSESYSYRHEPALTVPITAYGGVQDVDTPPAQVEAWREHTCGTFRRAMFPGGHFFLVENRSELLAELGRVLHRPGVPAAGEARA